MGPDLKRLPAPDGEPGSLYRDEPDKRRQGAVQRTGKIIGIFRIQIGHEQRGGHRRRGREIRRLLFLLHSGNDKPPHSL